MMKDILLKYGYKLNQPYNYWESNNKYLPDLDIDFKTIYYKFGPNINDFYEGEIEVKTEEILLQLINKYKKYEIK